MVHRPHERDTVEPFRQQREMLAEPHARHADRDRIKQREPTGLQEARDIGRDISGQ